MNKPFLIYCVMLLIGFEAATYKGYTVSSLFTSQHHKGQPGPHHK
jgi:hypothetical protein